MKTILSINEDRFLINDKLIYSEIANCPKEYHGLLMNARFIQGVFDDKADVARFNRYGKMFDPEQNTTELIESLPEWYNAGLRAITVGFQGGGPCFTINNQTIDNNPFSEDGTSMDKAYLDRMERIIDACDELGMVVIVSYFYGAQTRFLKDDLAIYSAVKTASNWLRDNKFTNVIIEIANEQNVGDFKIHPAVFVPREMAKLIELAKRESGGMPVGCSGLGGTFAEEIANASDVILIHGNGQTRHRYNQLIQKSKAVTPKRPVVCNEDSQAISQLSVSFKTQTSWGYYNNMTKQEPPTYWGITDGEDKFFARRMSEYLGIETKPLPLEDQFYLQGLEEHMTYEDQRWIRLASLYPEKIDFVDFYRDGVLVETVFDDPFTINYQNNWRQHEVVGIKSGEVWEAVVTLLDGQVVKKQVTVK